jgi:hypothetical protein
MYKSEYTLGLVASILNAVWTALLLIGLVATILFAGTAEWFIDSFGWDIHIPFYVNDMVGLATGIAALAVAVVFVFGVAATVLGFVGVSHLNKNNRNGGVLLLVGAGLSLLSGGFITMILLLIGGVLALSRKEPAVPQQP